MKLLKKSEVRTEMSKRNDLLIDESIRLHKGYKSLVSKFNSAKEDYSPEKLKALKEFEAFKADLTQKKSILLQELSSIEKAIEEKKELYYGLVEKQDVLIERIHNANERETKLDLREKFISQIEEKWKTS